MPLSFSEWPERASKNTGSPSYKHPHGISFLGWQQTSSQPRRAMNAHPPVGAAYSACARGGLADIRQPADVAARDPGDDGLVEILISLDAIAPPAGRLWVTSGPGSAPGRGEDKEFRFTGWLGLLRALYEVTGAPADGSLADP
jgi:hypothetical protein